jgi:hypothetical protein
MKLMKKLEPIFKPQSGEDRPQNAKTSFTGG